MSKTIPYQKCIRFVDIHPTSMLRVYTFQAPAAVAAMKLSGVLQCSRESLLRHSPHAAYDVHLAAYEWMAGQMRTEVGLSDGYYPVWAWLKRPDLRGKERKSWAGNVLISALVPRSRMMISDFIQFHDCINGYPVTINEAEAVAFDEARLADSESDYTRKVEASWSRIFDFSMKSLEEPFWRLRPRLVLQACIDRIYLHEVKWLRKIE